jgi:O-antigen/teichoic acid export membrane protein
MVESSVMGNRAEVETISTAEREPQSAQTRGTGLARNIVINLAGQTLPIVLAVFAIPVLLAHLGVDRFGVLALAWSLIGYFGIFDLGIGRALTQELAARLGAREIGEAPQVIWTSLLVLLALGLASAVLIAATSGAVVQLLRIPASLANETDTSLKIIALSIPFVIVSAGLRGVLEAHQRFDLVNAVRVPQGLSNFIGPLLVIPFSDNLIPVVATLFLGRVLSVAAFAWCCRVIEPSFRAAPRASRRAATRLVEFGMWTTVTALAAPVFSYLDRFMAGALVSAAAIAYYATPAEVVGRLTIVPASVAAVMFPAFAAAVRSKDTSALNRHFSRSLKVIFVTVFPISILLVGTAPELIRTWLGVEFAIRSARVLQFVSIGLLANSVAHIPFALLQGAGRPDLTAKLHVAELPLYVLALFWVVPGFGIEGAAFVWTGRAIADGLALFVMCATRLPIRLQLGRGIVPTLAAGAALTLATSIDDSLPRIAFVVAAIVLFVPLAWLRVMDFEDRADAVARVRSFRASF